MSLLSCRHFSERHTRSLDEPLKGWDKFAYRFHFCICYVCRRFSNQMTFLDRILRLISRRDIKPESTKKTPNPWELSEESSERIKAMLREQENQRHHH